ncbi:MAG TPA: twin-arginine translocase TatA/TatE family subunit [Candidatus Acidoferrales bacterium]|nr:twin-arginine translocase TatA/TatE family subunit [Candidatus Acidoferrales bacterium]
MLSIPHLIVIFIVALVVFGPEKIPELARNLGKVMAEFRRHTGDLRSTFEGHLRDLEREADTRRIAAPSPAPAPAPAPAAEPQPAPPAPGTVPSAPPNASALATPNPPSIDPYTHEPMEDPLLKTVDFEAQRNEPAPASEPSAEEKTPERVTNGDVRPA